jgi:hypothetical protein
VTGAEKEKGALYDFKEEVNIDSATIAADEII